MYFLRASLSLTVLIFFLGATYAQDYDPESSIIPTTTAPPHTTITNQPAQAPCLFTMNGIVFDTCSKASHPAELSESQLPHTTPTPFHAGCLVTINNHVFDTCILSTSNIGNSQITVTPRKSSSNQPQAVNCYTTVGTKSIWTCGAAETLTPGCRQPNAACLTTLTAHEGHVVVVDCGDGFESGHPPTMTSPSPNPAKPTTVCIENRCFDVVGTFGSPASATATPTQTQSKDEL
jgi:hypothetical protein